MSYLPNKQNRRTLRNEKKALAAAAAVRTTAIQWQARTSNMLKGFTTIAATYATELRWSSVLGIKNINFHLKHLLLSCIFHIYSTCSTSVFWFFFFFLRCTYYCPSFSLRLCFLSQVFCLAFLDHFTHDCEWMHNIAIDVNAMKTERRTKKNAKKWRNNRNNVYHYIKTVVSTRSTDCEREWGKRQNRNVYYAKSYFSLLYDLWLLKSE